MKKKKVLFLLEAFDKGGIEKVTLDIVNNLNPEKYDITVQTFWYGGHCQAQVNENVRVIPFFFKRYVKGIIRLIEYLPARWLYRLFVQGDYDVEIAASDGGAAKVISGSNNKKAKKICWVHMDVVNRGSQLKEFNNSETAQKIYKKFNLIVPVSNACKEKFIEKFGEQNYKFVVKRNPLPVEEILNKAKRPTVIEMEKGINFACVGRLEEQKGFDRLIDACAQIKEILLQKNVHIYILGEGTKRNLLEEQIKKCGLDNIIKLKGFFDNPYPVIKNADAFLLSSRDESFSLVIGECLLVGTPVVATDCCGVSEWLEDDKYGLIVENSITGIKEGLLTILQQPLLLQLYKRRIAKIADTFSFEKSLLEFEEILNE